MAVFDRFRKSGSGNAFTTPTPRDVLAVEINGEELDLIEEVLYWAWNQQNHHSQSLRDGTGPVPGFMKALRMRIGAAAAAADAAPTGIPLLEHEIETVEKAVHELGSSHWQADDSVPRKGRSLVAQLHVRLGYAYAVRHVGKIPVFRALLEPAVKVEVPEEFTP